jgi:hypothetical protein
MAIRCRFFGILLLLRRQFSQIAEPETRMSRLVLLPSRVPLDTVSYSLSSSLLVWTKDAVMDLFSLRNFSSAGSMPGTTVRRFPV